MGQFNYGEILKLTGGCAQRMIERGETVFEDARDVSAAKRYGRQAELITIYLHGLSEELSVGQIYNMVDQTFPQITEVVKIVALATTLYAFWLTALDSFIMIEERQGGKDEDAAVKLVHRRMLKQAGGLVKETTEDPPAQDANPVNISGELVGFIGWFKDFIISSQRTSQESGQHGLPANRAVGELTEVSSEQCSLGRRDGRREADVCRAVRPNSRSRSPGGRPRPERIHGRVESSYRMARHEVPQSTACRQREEGFSHRSAPWRRQTRAYQASDRPHH
jgi:hypothetical protein